MRVFGVAGVDRDGRGFCRHIVVYDSRGALDDGARLHGGTNNSMNVSNYSTIAEVTAAVKSGKVSPVELVDATLARIEKLNPKLSAFMHLDAAGARRQARAGGEAGGRGEAPGPLQG